MYRHLPSSLSSHDCSISGVLYIALGVNAKSEYLESSTTLKGVNHSVFEDNLQNTKLTIEQQAHLAKTKAYWLSPFEYTLLLDADTRVKGTKEELCLGFRMLRDGWDLVMIPSIPNRPRDVLWNLSPEEQKLTFQELGCWSHVMLNTGVMYFRRNERVRKLFLGWEEEWLRFKDRDQGAFLRALVTNPVRLFILSQAFNSRFGEVIEHLFGRAV